MAVSTPLDLTALGHEGALERLGDVVATCLGSHGVVVIVRKDDNSATLLPSTLLQHVGAEEMAAALLGAGWTEEETCNFLASLGTREA